MTVHLQKNTIMQNRCGGRSASSPAGREVYTGRVTHGAVMRLVSDHLAIVDGMEVGILLFETNGDLSSLEVYSCAGSDQPFGLPDTTSIRPLPS
jgi:hypothetical protein